MAAEPALKNDTDLLERNAEIAQQLGRRYEAGFTTAIESDAFPPGLSEDVVRALSARKQELVEAGVDGGLAARVASGEISAALLDIADVSAACNRSMELVAGVYFALGTQLNYGWISERAAMLPTPTHWDTMARASALADVARLKRTLTTSALAQSSESSTPDAIVKVWCAQREAALVRYAQLLGDLRAAGGTSLAVLLVIVREMAALERA